MTNSDDASRDARYDEIVSKLEALLRKHKGGSPASEPGGAAYSASIMEDAVEAPLTASDNIPTLTEAVHIIPAMLSPQSDITSLLGQILDSALRDAGADLDAAARKTLVQALESRLFGL